MERRVQDAEEHKASGSNLRNRDVSDDDDDVGAAAWRQPVESRGQLIKLEAGDGIVVTVDLDVACKSVLISQMLTDLGINREAEDARLEEALPVTNCDGDTLKKMMEYCTLKKDVVFRPKGEHEDPRVTLTAEYVEYLDVPNEELLKILLGANYLDIPELIEICTQKIADFALGKTTEEMRVIFGLENDFSAQEEEQLRNQFAWIEY